MTDTPTTTKGRRLFARFYRQMEPPHYRANVAYPRITLVTPAYNHGHFIEDTIQSVLAQHYPNLEYFVIDGGSRDNTVDILQRYADQLAGWVSESDNGQTHAINKGLAQGTGDIIGWLNSDDLLLPGALREVAHAFMDHPHYQVVTGMNRTVYEESGHEYNRFVWLPRSDVLRLFCVVAQETTFWRREVQTAIGLLDESFQFAMDYDYWQRMLVAHYRFNFLPHYLSVFRQHQSAKSTAHRPIRTMELARIYQRHNIAQDEDDALNKLALIAGSDWRTKVNLYKRLGHQRISDWRYLFLVVFYLTNWRVTSWLWLLLFRRYTGGQAHVNRDGA
jgi:glycosyltransferase involved in cell wall biosynthesis